MSMINEYRENEIMLEFEDAIASKFSYEKKLPPFNKRINEVSKKIAEKYNVISVTSESVEVDPIRFNEYTASRIGAMALVTIMRELGYEVPPFNEVNEVLEKIAKKYGIEIKVHPYSPIVNAPRTVEIVKKSRGRKKPHDMFRITFSKDKVEVWEEGKDGNTKPFSKVVTTTIDKVLKELYDVKPKPF